MKKTKPYIEKLFTLQCHITHEHIKCTHGGQVNVSQTQYTCTLKKRFTYTCINMSVLIYKEINLNMKIMNKYESLIFV